MGFTSVNPCAIIKKSRKKKVEEEEEEEEEKMNTMDDVYEWVLNYLAVQYGITDSLDEVRLVMSPDPKKKDWLGAEYFMVSTWDDRGNSLGCFVEPLNKNLDGLQCTMQSSLGSSGTEDGFSLTIYHTETGEEFRPVITNIKLERYCH